MKTDQKAIKFFSRRIVQHSIFWLFLITIEFLGIVERTDVENYHPYIIGDLIKYMGIAIAIYVNLQILIPYYITKKSKPGIYIVLLLTLVIGVTILFYHLSYIVLKLPHPVRPDNVSSDWRIVFHCIQTTMLVIITTLIHFTKEWIRIKDVQLDMEKIEKENLSAELKTLKAQINPHFLFNTLNNIYSLSLDKSDKSPELILRLSDLMSYILYEGKEEFISLNKEVEFIDNYIGLEKVRIEDHVDIKFEQSHSGSSNSIAPLLFVPLVENAFKYVSDTESKPAFINISINEKDNYLEFVSENSFGEQTPDIDNKYKGIGVENVRKRLELIYSGKHTFEITKENGIYRVKLSIDLS